MAESATPGTTKDVEVGGAEHSLGRYLIEVREKRGISREQAISQTRIPKHYVVMIESDDYSLIADQLYLMPFLRRYAVFLGLDPDDIISRFIRDVQRADGNIVKISEPIVSARERRASSRRFGALVVAFVIFLAAAAVLYLHRYPWRTLFERPTAKTPASAPSQ
jgi:cytoskeleton protein RodZ